MDPLLLPSDAPGRPPGLPQVEDSRAEPRLPRAAAAIERLGHGALAFFLAALSVRLAFTVQLRDERGQSLSAELLWNLGIGLGLAVFLMLAWAVVAAPMLSLLSMRTLRLRWAASHRVPVVWLALLAFLSAAIPLLYVGALNALVPDGLRDFRDIAWVWVGLAAINPIIVFIASITVMRDRVVRIVVLALALASLIDLANTLWV